jgi:hypothetical protein
MLPLAAHPIPPVATRTISLYLATNDPSRQCRVDTPTKNA